MGDSAERADRFKSVRVALDLTQPEFAAKLNALATALGIDGDYTQLNVSQRETARLELDVEDYAVVSSIDPTKWSWEWLAFGRKLTRGAKLRVGAEKTG